MSVFTLIKFARPEPPEEAVKPCLLGLCDGSGLVERESAWFAGVRLVKCLCRDL